MSGTMKDNYLLYYASQGKGLLRQTLQEGYNDYLKQVAKTLEIITTDNTSHPSEYDSIINNIVTNKVIEISDHTMRKISQAVNSSEPEITPFFIEHVPQNQSQGTGTKVFISDKSFPKKLLAIMRGENYTSGECAMSESFVRQTISQMGPEHTMSLLMSVYDSNYDSPHILIGLLHMLSHFDYDVVRPYGPIMALGLLQHKSYSVREFAIKAFENWASTETLIYLKNIKCDQPWLQEYLDNVIADIEQQ